MLFVFVSRVGCRFTTLDLSLSKLSIAQSSGKFPERHRWGGREVRWEKDGWAGIEVGREKEGLGGREVVWEKEGWVGRKLDRTRKGRIGGKWGGRR